MALISVEVARDHVWAAVGARGPLAAERVDAAAAVGRVLAAPVVATEDLPGFDDSAMDGYAGRAADFATAFELGSLLPVVAQVPAGADPAPLPPGTLARIFTGAALPVGADSVLIQEEAEVLVAAEGLARVGPKRAVPAGANVRHRGSDVRAGVPVLAEGRVLSPGDVGLLAALGRTRVAVHRRPVVAILGSGDELLPVDAGRLPPGRRRDSNAWQLAAAVIEAGGVPRVLPTVPDRFEASLAAVAEAVRGADVLLTSGGVSVGDHDHLGTALHRLAGGSLGFHRVALRPGKPFAFGVLSGVLVFGLPGNPVSAGVTFELFVRPTLLALAGHRRCFRRAVPARLTSPLPAGDGREAWLRGGLAEAPDGLWIDVGRTQSSGALSSLAGADALLRVPVGAAARAAGETVWVHRLDTDDRVARFDAGG